MPRMSKKRRLEWAFFLNERNRITFNALCRGCTHDCKQSFRAIVVLCPRYYSKRWKARPTDKENQDNRKYYYLKLKESYFDDDAIVLLESMQDGMLYSNILLKLYLKSLKYGGTLQLDENIPYTAQMIATITRQQVGTVERALQIFMKLGLVEPLDNGALYMSNIELFIGQSSTEGERKRRARMKISEQKRLSGQVSEAKADICPPEIEIKKEIDIEIEKERELETGHPAPAAYGRYKNVILTDTELSELKAELPDKWEYYIDRLSGYIASSGRKYKNHAATIRRWVADDTAKAAPKRGIPDYSYKEGESL